MASSSLELDIDQEVIPFHGYLWKIASRCNLNCTYCFVYNLADQQWKTQPHFMSEPVARQASRRIREHLEAHDKQDLLITFHGGEPLLGGLKHLKMLVEVIDDESSSRGFKVTLSMQSNLTLLTEEIADFLLSRSIKIGTSLDGPPEWNDLVRIDHQGRPSSAMVERALRLITLPKYKAIWSGILCVINPFSDPLAVLNYLVSFPLPFIDFLFPLNHHDNLPAGKQRDVNASPYADWLIKAFDYWWGHGAAPDVRIFTSIMRLCCGFHSQTESLGAEKIEFIVVETNGDIEGLDSLKSTFDGATRLGASCNVFESTFDAVARHSMVTFRQSGSKQLCEKCRACPVVAVCGGGYLPHRYSSKRGFENPSVYCTDLEKLIRHIHSRMEATVGPTERETCA